MQTPIKQLHTAQMKILYELRHAETARYRDILRASGLENDGFRFHLNTLSKYGYIEKNVKGYALTAAGKEFANNLDRTARTSLKQPKLSIILVVTREIAGTTQYLFQQRKRQPYYNFWGYQRACHLGRGAGSNRCGRTLQTDRIARRMQSMVFLPAERSYRRQGTGR